MISIKDQAVAYADRVQRRGLKVLFLFPKKKSSQAFTNKFRRLVLEYLVNWPNNGYFTGTEKQHLCNLEVMAEELGYIITEVPAEDYDGLSPVPSLLEEQAS